MHAACSCCSSATQLTRDCSLQLSLNASLAILPQKMCVKYTFWKSDTSDQIFSFGRTVLSVNIFCHPTTMAKKLRAEEDCQCYAVSDEMRWWRQRVTISWTFMPEFLVFPCLYCLLLRLWCFTEIHKITACGSKTVHGGNKQTTIKHNTHIISN